MGGLKPAVLLDRDGTLNVRPPAHDYVRSVDDFVWLPGAVEALARLSKAGYLLAVVSNQRGLARGLVTPATLEAIEAKIQVDLAAYQSSIAAFRYCPHDLGDNCLCRKPRPGMLRDLAELLSLDLQRSWMVGDCDSDVQAGRAAGCRTALIARDAGGVDTDIVAPTLYEASTSILAAADGQRAGASSEREGSKSSLS